MNDKENKMNDKKYKIIIGGLVFVVLILIGLLIYIATKKTNNNNNSNSTTTSSTTTTSTTTTTTGTTTTTTTTTPKNLATNFDMFPEKNDSNVTSFYIDDLLEHDNLDLNTNFKNIKLNKYGVDYSVTCTEYDPDYEYSSLNCVKAEININNLKFDVPTDSQVNSQLYYILKFKENMIVFYYSNSDCGTIKIYKNSNLVYRNDHLNAGLGNNYISDLFNKKYKKAFYPSDAIRYVDNKVYFLADTVDGYIILKSINLNKSAIEEEQIAKVKFAGKAENNCYNNFKSNI